MKLQYYSSEDENYSDRIEELTTTAQDMTVGEVELLCDETKWAIDDSFEALGMDETAAQEFYRTIPWPTFIADSRLASIASQLESAIDMWAENIIKEEEENHDSYDEYKKHGPY